MLNLVVVVVLKGSLCRREEFIKDLRVHLKVRHSQQDWNVICPGGSISRVILRWHCFPAPTRKHLRNVLLPLLLLAWLSVSVLCVNLARRSSFELWCKLCSPHCIAAPVELHKRSATPVKLQQLKLLQFKHFLNIFSR